MFKIKKPLQLADLSAPDKIKAYLDQSARKSMWIGILNSILFIYFGGLMLLTGKGGWYLTALGFFNIFLIVTIHDALGAYRNSVFDFVESWQKAQNLGKVETESLTYE